MARYQIIGGLLRKAKGATDIMWSIIVHACLLVLWTWMFPELGLLNISYAFIVALILFIPDFFIARPIAALSCNAAA